MFKTTTLAYQLVLSLLLFTCSLMAQDRSLLTFSVASGDFERHNSPLSFSLEGIALPAGQVQLYELSAQGKTAVPFQIEQGESKRIYWILSGKTPAGSKRIFELRSGAGAKSSSQINAVREKGAIVFQNNQRNVLRYQYAEAEVPAGKSELFRRGGFIHPLWSPKGEVLTRIQPSDHLHHYGIWNPWTSTLFEGRKLDFWNLYKAEGTVKVVGLPVFTQGSVLGTLNAKHEHVDLMAPSPTGSKAALEESWNLKIWNTGDANAPQVIDFQSVLHCATDSIFTIKAYTYQGFGFRATEKWDDNTARLLTSEGKGKSDGNATRARWIDARGVSNFGQSGVLFMTHPLNYNYPEQLRLWGTGQNEGKSNVFINFNPAQEQDWVLNPGQSYALNYRMVTYDGELSAETLEKIWQDYANPPKVQVILNQTKANKKVLVYTKNGKGYVHDNLLSSIIAIQKLGAANGFSVDSSSNPASITPENLSQYQALILSNTNNETFDTEAQKLAFQRYIQAGGGMVAIHSASGSERQWPWFWRTLGGKFRYHPPLQRFNIQVIDPLHPSTLHLPAIWSWEDECYFLEHLYPGKNVLLAGILTDIPDEKKNEYPGKTFGKLIPLCWYEEQGLGRTWYTALGHKKEYYSDPTFMQHLLGGILWVLDGSDRLDYSKATKVLINE
jgi:type 1 glutamine amidotransferase